ncbi:MAG: J domain-containing protein [Jaaginema sp. PMC 1079.18]|nr:J domain-containing protein [Jaaginema sp. PMC 1080.18]MEC4851252.1 J domain-containing protein [Jaaginema sp. PMC 1079.18]MEC4866415.1 J domain-containing protein [Jaaginema sp. PMC 1078.18]
MKLVDCYRLLGVAADASLTEIKASYRRLARRYHPDVNPGNRQQAQAQFVRLTEAYQQALQTAVNAQEVAMYSLNMTQTVQAAQLQQRSRPLTTQTTLSRPEQQLKTQSYQSLQQLLQAKRFARAIALVEGLAQRLPQDPEVRQWQAIAYQQWGRQLARDRAYNKAYLYLKKALRTDPHNRSLRAEIQRNFQEIEQSRQG